ncbi:hypothetical protein LSH36_819g02055 [Paralvinella palmiformis]|uniref:Uncharacterized protein n=1 Tax=Paralvinella palmiformis TaxID=53620 RepID=A0AAD9J138_9ANNE|nr:hypothetical protein LSH36_819g02055 [Paralvinella palmiformis]
MFKESPRTITITTTSTERTTTGVSSSTDPVGVEKLSITACFISYNKLRTILSPYELKLNTAVAIRYAHLFVQSTGGKQKTVIIISVVVTVGVVLLFIISLGCVLFWRKRPVSEPQTDYRQMNNPVYGIESDLSGFGLSDEVSAQKNISPTTNIYDSIRI